MRISDLLAKKGSDVQTIDAASTMAAAVSELVGTKARSLVVTDGGAVVGMLTGRDILGWIDRDGGDVLTLPVGEAMSKPVVTATPETPVGDVEKLFIEKRINHVPIVSNGKLVGIVTLADLLREHLGESDAFSEDLLRYIHGPFTL